MWKGAAPRRMVEYECFFKDNRGSRVALRVTKKYHDSFHVGTLIKYAFISLLSHAHVSKKILSCGHCCYGKCGDCYSSRIAVGI